MKNLKISQSALKDFYDEDKCDLVFGEKYLNGFQLPDDQMPKIWLDGLIFETGVLGANRSGKIYQYHRKVDGGLTVREKEMNVFIEEAKHVLYDVKKIRVMMVQPEIIYKQYIGHLDALIMFEEDFQEALIENPHWADKSTWELEELRGHKVHILDTKFTNASEIDRYNGWAEPQFRIERQPEQPLMYVWLMNKVLGIHPEFYFYIQGASGWKKFVRVRITPDMMTHFELRLEKFDKDIAGWIPKPIGRHTICRKCYFYESCPLSTRFPETEEVELDVVSQI